MEDDPSSGRGGGTEDFEDEEAHDFGDEEGDEHADRQGSRADHGPPQKRARDEKYSIPSTEEASLLRETEGKLFEGNLLRLEVEELLAEVRVDHGKKSVKALEEWLHVLKDTLEKLPPCIVTEESLDLEGIRLANHVPGKPVALEFQPPEADGFDVAGSFLLRALTKPSLNVDLALCMPSECLVARDSLNHRYLDKRALYAGHLAATAMDAKGSLGKLVDKVELSYLKGDPRKPVVLLYPALSVSKKGKKDKAELKLKVKPSTGFVVRLLPCCPRDVMTPARLVPGRNNVRTRAALAELADMEGGDAVGGGGGEELVASLPATPHYNSAILEDMCMKEHLAALHGMCGDSEAFRDAIILGKVWLGQHGMRTSHDSMGGYEWSMLLLRLAQTRRVNARMAALSIFQVALKVIADGELSSKCMTVDVSIIETDEQRRRRGLTLEEEKSFRDAFAAVMVDTSLGFNVFARLSSSAVSELEMTAKASIGVLQTKPAVAFRRLLMTRTTLWRKCDAFVQIPLVSAEWNRTSGSGSKKGKAAQRNFSGEGEGAQEEEGLLDRPLWSYVSSRITRLLREGLGDRCVLARPLCGVSGEAGEDFRGIPGPRGWDPRCAPPAGVEGGRVEQKQKAHPMLTFGLIIDATFAGRLVDKGPRAEDGPAARKFREFWGDKSELRRFKDGSIVEAVVWKGRGAQRHRVVEQVVRHVLARHDPVRCAESAKRSQRRADQDDERAVRFRGNELLGLVAVGGVEAGATEDDELTRSALKALQKLQEMAKAADGMPLRVEALQAASPLLRYTSLLPPVPHPLATSQGEAPTPLPSQATKITSQVEPMEVVLRLESSSKWPDGLEAVRSTGTAFLIRLAQCLERKHKLRCVVGRRSLDVLTGGYCFRLRIGGDRELSLLGQDKINAPEFLALQEAVVLAAPHHSSIHGLHLQKPAFGLTVRAASRWLEEHMMSEHLRVEAVELLVASLFSDEAPLAPPSTGLAGFLRFLLLLAGHDWTTAPLLVDPQGELSAAERAAATEAFSRSRERDHNGGSSMYIVAPYARDMGWASSWTTPRPERPVLGRLVALAKASAESLVGWLSGNGKTGKISGGWKHAFRMAIEEAQTFDARLLLNSAVMSDTAPPSLSGSETFQRRRVKGCPALQTSAYKNLLGGGVTASKGKGLDTTHGSLVVGFDPIGDLVSELRRRFGHLAVFFSPGSAGASGIVGLVWRPSAFVPRPYNVNRSRHMMVVGDLEGKGEGEGQGTGRGGALMVMNVLEVLAEMKALGGDMFEGVHVS
eukprot:g9031.t1